METLFNATLIVLPILYTLLVMAYSRILARGTGGIALMVRPLMVVTVLVHLASILLRAVIVRACPLGTPAEFLSLVAYAVTVIYLILEVRIGDRSTGVFAIAPALVLQVVASVGMLGEGVPEPVTLGALASLHTFAALVGCSAIAICSVYGVLYLALYAAIKGGRFGLFYRKMPSLETLSDLNYIATWIAFIALTGMLGLGIFGLVAGEGRASFLSLEVVLGLLLWLLYGGAILAKRFLSIGGKRLAYSTVLGLVLVALIFVGGFLAEGFHR